MVALGAELVAELVVGLVAMGSVTRHERDGDQRLRRHGLHVASGGVGGWLSETWLPGLRVREPSTLTV